MLNRIDVLNLAANLPSMSDEEAFAVRGQIKEAVLDWSTDLIIETLLDAIYLAQ